MVARKRFFTPIDQALAKSQDASSLFVKDEDFQAQVAVSGGDDFVMSEKEFGEYLESELGHINSRDTKLLYDEYVLGKLTLKQVLTEYLKGEPSSSLPSAENGSSIETEGSVDDLNQKILDESKRQIQLELDSRWSQFIGTFNVEAYATRPMLRPLVFEQKLELRRLQSKKQAESSIARIFTTGTDSREIGRVPEEFNKFFSPLLDLEMCVFDMTVLMTTKGRLSIGDSFYVQVDCFLTNMAFASKKTLYSLSQTNGFISKGSKRQKSTSTSFDYMKESEGEWLLKLRQYSLSELFGKLEIKPLKMHNDTEEVNNDDNNSSNDVIDCDDEQYDLEAQDIKPVDQLNVNQLTKFYQNNNQSELFTTLPETTTPPTENFKVTLRPYQKHGLSWLLTREKEISVLEELANQNGSNNLSTQSRTLIKSREEGVFNPLWRKYKWPKDISYDNLKAKTIGARRGSGSNYFYANMYNGELSIEVPILKTALKGGIIADEMGLGKTISTYALISSVPFDTNISTQEDQNSGSRYASKTTLIVLPMSLLQQWKNEFDKINANTKFKCQIYYGDLTTMDLRHSLCKDDDCSEQIPVVLLTTYGTIVNEYIRYNKLRDKDGNLPNFGIYSVKFFRIVLDEAHNIRNRSTKTAKSVNGLKASRRWALTGTPIINRLDDLYSLIKFLQVEPWSNFSYWKTFITLPFEQKKADQTLEVIQAILEPILLRRTKNMKQKNGKLLVELPEKEVIVENLTLSEKEQKVYDWFKVRASNTFQEGLRSGELLKKYSQILTQILRLRQICCHINLVGSTSELELDVDTNGKESDEILKEIRQLILSRDENDEFKTQLDFKQCMYSLYKLIDLENSECSICTESPISIGEHCITHCGHQYCLSCILDHIEFQQKSHTQPLCPNCRQPLSKYKIFRILNRETRRKEVNFYSQAVDDDDDDTNDYKFKLYLYDPRTTSTKIQALIRHLKIIRQQKPGEKVVVFSQFSSYLDIIESELKIQGSDDYQVYKFDGRMKMNERQLVLDKFNSPIDSDKVSVLLLSLKAGGVGLNLTTASTAFMMDIWWAPSIEDQAIDRIHRIGQDKNVKVIRFIVENSIEQKMLKIQARKKQLGEAVSMEEEEVKRQRRIEDIKTLFEEEVN